MSDFISICERVNDIFKRGGYPGIGEVKEGSDYWIFLPASSNIQEVEYGRLGPYYVEKKNGKIESPLSH